MPSFVLRISPFFYFRRVDATQSFIFSLSILGFELESSRHFQSMFHSFGFQFTILLLVCYLYTLIYVLISFLSCLHLYLSIFFSHSVSSLGELSGDAVSLSCSFDVTCFFFVSFRFSSWLRSSALAALLRLSVSHVVYWACQLHAMISFAVFSNIASAPISPL